MRAEQWVGVASGALGAVAGQAAQGMGKFGGNMLTYGTQLGSGFVANGLNYDDDGNNDSTKRLKIY